MILTVKTDNPQAEVGLYDDTAKQISYYDWHAHRELSATLLTVINDQLEAQDADFKDITGIVVYKGPGSFTGLRIGIAVTNAMAYALSVPVVGTNGDSWQKEGVELLKSSQKNNIVLPEYGAGANITLPKK
ncbi:MAG: tRNA (adenosine(37)-N6)-threonylcarbamoyltransferase complex dimerization subunit type 1 TsaB [Candidatus Woesebacteria bacterium]|jgi:tRNA threonylcarbamoyladenosine biosynthesis protein TsaB